MSMIFSLIVKGIAIFLTAYILPGVYLDGYLSALVVAAILSISNAIVKPILVILTLPLNILTLGLFTFVINAAIVLLVDFLVRGFAVGGFINALLFSLVLSVISWILNAVTNRKS